MYSDDYHGPRVEVTILKNGVKHKISQAYLMRINDVSDKVKHLVKQHPSLMYDYSMSLLSVVTSNGFELIDDRWSVSESRLVKYIPFVPVTNSVRERTINTTKGINCGLFTKIASDE